jgi:hypothetical protein
LLGSCRWSVGCGIHRFGLTEHLGARGNLGDAFRHDDLRSLS